MKTAILVVLFAIITACPIMSQQAQSSDTRPKITVNGDAVVYVKPDKVVVSLGIMTWDMEIMTAKLKSNEILTKTMSTIKGLGIQEKAIQTDHLSIEPRYKNNNFLKEDFIGYFVSYTLVVTLTETEKVDEFITKVLQAGVNSIHGIDFQTTEFKKYREQARELALKAAKEKAEKMASVLGQMIGTPIQISENSSYSHSSGRNLVQDMRDFSDISDTIPLGKISLQSNVTVAFELKQK